MLKKNLYRWILVLLVLFTSYTIYSSIFKIYKPDELMNPLIIIMGTIVLIFLFVRLTKFLDKIPESKANKIAIILCIVFLVGLIISGFLVTSIPVYDLSDVEREAELMLQNDGKMVTDDYFSMYSNQIPLTIFVYHIYKLGYMLNFSNLRLFATVINAVFIAITAFFTYLTVKKIENYKLGMLSLIFFILNPIFYMYVSYFYSDTLCMPFFAIAIYLIISSLKNKNSKKAILYEIIAVASLFLGAKIRIVVIFLLISYILIILISKEEKKTKLLTFGMLSIGLIVGIVFYGIISGNKEIQINEDMKFPITHWIMMGLNDEYDGKFNEDDFQYTYDGETYKQKIEKNLEKINERIQDLGPSGIIELFTKKMQVNWSNGTYDVNSKLLNSEEGINVVYNYICGDKELFITYFCQICKTTVLIVFLFAIIREYRSEEKKYELIFIATFGAFIFYLIWEVLTRYSLTFLPWIILPFGMGIMAIKDVLSIKEIKLNFAEKSDKKIKINLYAFSKIIFGISAILIIINFYQLAVKKEEHSDIRVIQYSSKGGNKIEITNGRTIEQEFITDKSFNSISIRFSKTNTNVITHYNFMLKDENGMILNEQNFTNDEIKDGRLANFNFERIKPLTKQKYIIQITSNDSSIENAVLLNLYELEDYSAYPDGVLKIDGNPKEADLVFQVQNDRIKTYVSKKEYAFISLLIICTEIFAFYPYLKYNKKV